MKLSRSEILHIDGTRLALDAISIEKQEGVLGRAEEEARQIAGYVDNIVRAYQSTPIPKTHQEIADSVILELPVLQSTKEAGLNEEQWTMLKTPLKEILKKTLKITEEKFDEYFKNFQNFKYLGDLCTQDRVYNKIKYSQNYHKTLVLAFIDEYLKLSDLSYDMDIPSWKKVRKELDKKSVEESTDM